MWALSTMFTYFNDNGERTPDTVYTTLLRVSPLMLVSATRVVVWNQVYELTDLSESAQRADGLCHWDHSIRSLRVRTMASGVDMLLLMKMTQHWTASLHWRNKWTDSQCQLAYLEIRPIGSIRHYLSFKATKTLVSSLVFSGLDYCNALLAGSPRVLLDKIESMISCSARLIFKTQSAHTHSFTLRSPLAPSRQPD